MENYGERAALRMWTQGIVANYSSANVNGAHEIIEVTEGNGYTDIVMQTRYGGLVLYGDDGKAYRTRKCRVSVTITADVEEVQ